MNVRSVNKTPAAAGKSAVESASPRDEILRFRRAERILHWSIAIPFMICFLTATILVVFYNPNPLRPYRVVFSWIHRLSGVGLIVFPLIAVIRDRSDFRIHLDNVKQAWVWTFDDLKWLSRMGLAAISSKVTLPEQGKFNAAEKLNFMMVMCSWPLFTVTGLLIWLPGVAFASWVLHFAMALVAAPLMLGHIFMATINPDTRVGLKGMITGYVDRQWAKHHYRRWYRENFEIDRVPRARRRPPTAAAPSPVFIRCNCCRIEIPVASWDVLLQRVLDPRPLICPSCHSEIDTVFAVPDPSLVDPTSILRSLERKPGGQLKGDIPL